MLKVPVAEARVGIMAVAGMVGSVFDVDALPLQTYRWHSTVRIVLPMK